MVSLLTLQYTLITLMEVVLMLEPSVETSASTCCNRLFLINWLVSVYQLVMLWEKDLNLKQYLYERFRIVSYIKYLIVFIFVSIAPGPVQSITVSILSQHFVNISWHPPSVLNGIIVLYDFNIFSLPPDSYRFTKTVLPEHDFFIALHNLREYNNT